MAEVSLKHITKIYPNIEKTKKHHFGKKAAEPEKKSNLKVTDEGVVAVEDFNLDIADREFVVLVGPSGCGKSTTLRMIAGLESISGGELTIDGKVMNEVAPKDRDIAMVFQSYALYPHMTVYDNMAFPLKLRKVPEDQIDQKVRQAAETLGITQYLDRKPKALSGGQRQRVAIGRAIVRKPKVFLMDEPLSNLDAKLRVTMRTEIRRIQQEVGITAIYVTHDQSEAMALSDRIIIMRSGVVEQIGSPQEIYYHPVNEFVADFIGEANFLKGRLEALSDKRAQLNVSGDICHAAPVPGMEVGKDYTIVLRPEAASLAEEGGLPCEVVLSCFMGSYQNYHVKVGDTLVKLTDPNPKNKRIYKVGERCRLVFDPESVHVL